MRTRHNGRNVYGIDAYRYAYKPRHAWSYRIAAALLKLTAIALLAAWLLATSLIGINGGIR